MERKKVAGTSDPRFALWWDSLPPHWREGVLAALNGGAAECELLRPSREPAVYVFFVPPDLAPVVRQALAAAQ